MIRDRWWNGRRTHAFTLQWHLTNACGFHCRHCYDRSTREELSVADTFRLFDDLLWFCRHRRVQPRLCLTGGDPLRHPAFWDVYEATAAARVSVSLLGNPIESDVMARLLAIRQPAFYQVSLEGLEAHNDEMRGPGHFEQTMTFLEAARERGLRTIVMLTLTRANLGQVIPLGDALAGMTSRFTFNRVSQVGEAQDLEAPTPEEFEAFLGHYLEARRVNPVFGVKDNLFSLVRDGAGKRAFRGCTGYGCGAAFNFLAVLPDGEVHACRKFPSPVGNIRQDSLDSIYDSQAARDYRRGTAACHGCHLRRVCGGCLASTHSAGLDPLRDRDPYCFASQMENDGSQDSNTPRPGARGGAGRGDAVEVHANNRERHSGAGDHDGDHQLLP